MAWLTLNLHNTTKFQHLQDATFDFCLVVQGLPDIQDADAAAAPDLLEDNAEAEFKLGDTSGTRVESVSTLNPVDDFNALVQQGRLEDALEGLQKAVYTLVDTSLGDRSDLISSDSCTNSLQVLCAANASAEVWVM